MSFEKGHNVNNAQALKWSAVWYLFSGDRSLRAAGRAAMANLDRHYGLPTGMFNGDEILPVPPTRNPLGSNQNRGHAESRSRPSEETFALHRDGVDTVFCVCHKSHSPRSIP